jgi:hypothetical protein
MTKPNNYRALNQWRRSRRAALLEAKREFYDERRVHLALHPMGKSERKAYRRKMARNLMSTQKTICAEFARIKPS